MSEKAILVVAIQCPKCLGVTSMREAINGARGAGDWVCKACGSKFKNSEELQVMGPHTHCVYIGR